MNMKKILVLALSLVLVAAISITGTLAWLQDSTTTIKNTFTVGDINIELKETTTDYKMVPGNTIAKDPTVTVTAKSEDSWVFVKIEESSNLMDFISYTVAEGWTALSGQTGVYYREYEGDAAATYTVLAGNKVTVNSDVTKEEMEKLTDATNPTLSFTAYAVQKDNLTVNQAWEVAQGKEPTPTPTPAE